MDSYLFFGDKRRYVVRHGVDEDQCSWSIVPAEGGTTNIVMVTPTHNARAANVKLGTLKDLRDALNCRIEDLER